MRFERLTYVSYYPTCKNKIKKWLNLKTKDLHILHIKDEQ